MLKRLPVGISDFKTIIEENYYYFDKTHYIEDIINATGIIKLFTRPRRFGKTLNLSTLKYFFDIRNSKENRQLFSGLRIENSNVFSRQGQYPVIFLSLKDIKFNTWIESETALKALMSKLYEENSYLFDTLNELNKKYFEEILYQKRLDPNALSNLIKYLFEYHNRKVVLLIDEYDTAIISAFANEYYDEAMNFFRAFYGAALKDNVHLQLGIMTGILRVAKEGIFSGVNNLMVYSIFQKEFGSYFGFTQEEVDQAINDFNVKHLSLELKDWYNGYKFGSIEIYNPWSILNFIAFKELKPYWINTSDNYIINLLLSNASEETFEELKEVFKGNTIDKEFDDTLNLKVLKEQEVSNTNDLWQLLTFSGYLKIEKELNYDEFSLKIPNKEIQSFFEKSFIKTALRNENLTSFNKMLIALTQGDMDLFEVLLNRIFKSSISYYDLGNQEKLYHNLILGMVLALHRDYDIYSNRESGLGRYDICLEPKDKSKLGIIFEFKVGECSDNLVELSQQAIMQIKEKQYFATMQSHGINNILLAGMSFYGKEMKLAFEYL